MVCRVDNDLCGLLGTSLICEVYAKSGSYTYVVKVSSTEHVLYKCPFSTVLLYVIILSAFLFTYSIYVFYF